MKNNPPRAERSYNFFIIFWTGFTGLLGLFFLYLKFPEEILNEQSATPKRETFATRPEEALMVSYAIKLLIHDFRPFEN